MIQDRILQNENEFINNKFIKSHSWYSKFASSWIQQDKEGFPRVQQTQKSNECARFVLAWKVSQYHALFKLILQNVALRGSRLGSNRRFYDWSWTTHLAFNWSSIILFARVDQAFLDLQVKTMKQSYSGHKQTSLKRLLITIPDTNRPPQDVLDR